MIGLKRTLVIRVAAVALLLLPAVPRARRGPALARSLRQSPPQSASQAQSLEQLRADFALRFMEPQPHMALAKYFRDRGERLQAFLILETARRGRFEEAVFDRAFAASFLGKAPFDNGREAEAALLAEHARDPKSVEAVVKLADIYISRDDWTKSKEYLGKAISLEPEDFENVEALAEVFRRAGDEAGSARLLADYARKHPETEGGYRVKISESAEKNPARARLLLAEAVSKFPREGGFVFHLGTELQREGKLKEAEEHFVRAAELSPGSSYMQAWVGRFFHKVRKDDRRALDYYLNAYLLDPHAYETEFVESRIPKIANALAEADIEKRLKGGATLAEIAEDRNPFVVMLAVGWMAREWKPAHLRTMLALLGHDEGFVRWRAAEAIMGHADRSFDETLRALLGDGDLRKRGLAAYVALRLWKQESFPALRELLRSDAQLLRFDAVSALVMEGGPEGRKIVLEHAAREPNPRLKKLIEAATNGNARQPD